jgi:hypothetical protein
LRSAVDGGYIAYSAMDREPSFDAIRKDPEFLSIRTEAERRQRNFLAKTHQARP